MWVVLILAAAILVPDVSTAQTPQIVRVTAEQAALRAEPASDARTVVTVVRDAELEVLAVQGSWLRVRPLGGTTEGFVHSLLVTAVNLGSGGAAAGTSPVVGLPMPAFTDPRPRRFAVGFAGDGLGKVGGPSLRFDLGPLGLEAIGTRDDGVTFVSALGSLRVAERSVLRAIDLRLHLGGGVVLTRVGDLCERRLGLPGCGEETMGATAFSRLDVHGGPGGRFTLSGKVSWIKTPEFLGYGQLGLALGLHIYLQ